MALYIQSNSHRRRPLAQAANGHGGLPHPVCTHPAHNGIPCPWITRAPAFSTALLSTTSAAG